MRHASRRPPLPAALFLGCLAGLAPAARAQPPAPDSGANVDEGGSASPVAEAPGSAEGVADVVVTARKRSERVLDVPQSISVLTPEEIESRGADNISELQQDVPGLRIVQLSPGTQRIELRGISQYQGLDTVGSYLNEVSVAGVQGADPDIRLVDMSGVEVLRGPQPTLYGNNSVGGTIRYITAAPNLNAFGGHVLGEGGFVQDGGGHDREEGVVNIPLIQGQLAVRLAVNHDDSGGWVDAPALGRKDINSLDATTYRASVLYRPVEELTVSFVYQYQSESQDGQNFSGQSRKTTSVVATPTEDDFHYGNLVVAYDLGAATLLSTTGYYYRDVSDDYDVTPFYASLLPAGGVAPELLSAADKSIQEEVRLTSNASGPLRYTIGANYYDVRSAQTTAIDTSPKTSFSPFLDFNETAFTKSQSWAVFGSVGYDVLDWLSVDLGGRYFQDDQTLGSDVTSFGGGRSFQNTTFHTLNPRLDVKIRTSENGIVYANVAKGFRSGGFNPISTAAVPQAFGPETLYTYEIGAKQQLFSRRLTIQPAFFYNDYKNVQEQLPIPGNVQGNGFTLNAGKASGPGFDLSAALDVTPALSLGGQLGYNHLRTDTASLAKLPGDPLDLVPDWTWSIEGDYHANVADDVRLSAHADVSHTDTGQLTLRNFQPIVFSSPYTLVGARVALDWDRYEVYAYARNLLDTNRKVQPAFGGYAEPLWTTPRTVALGVRMDF